MTSEGTLGNVEVSKAFLDSLQSDFKTLSSESKKKYPQVREVRFCYCLITRY